ncbi:MAG TPA: gluconate 2-dehydrogenase subunit 3 family protein [Candidatus Dormibacteraeota bacterium]|nr:gluconate 2-dehydrogenase subunit 3 family protein [Candidatus Dormibacteraeota bacterium]
MGDPKSGERFPGFDVLAQSDHWDATTRRVVTARLDTGGGRNFFTADEEPVCRALCATLLALDGSPGEPPVFEMIDGRLAEGITDGWHYDDMPADAEAWRRSLAELERRGFRDADDGERRSLIEAVRADRERLAGMPGKRLFDLWMRYACTAYYAHPTAWNEIGFGGPAYPRGYKNLGLDRREPWEVEEAGARDPIPVVERAERPVDPERQRRRAG